MDLPQFWTSARSCTVHWRRDGWCEFWQRGCGTCSRTIRGDLHFSCILLIVYAFSFTQIIFHLLLGPEAPSLKMLAVFFFFRHVELMIGSWPPLGARPHDVSELF